MITDADYSVYSEKISYFARMLRREGMVVGPKETEDACRILTILGMEDRAAVKCALMTVFAKSREEQTIFERVFDGFFISEDAMRMQAKEQMKREAEQRAAEEEARRQLKEQGGPSDLTDEQISTYALMPEEVREHLHEIMEKYRPRKDNDNRLYTNFIHSVFARSIMEMQMKMEDAAAHSDAVDAEVGILYRDISDFRDAEIPKATALIKNISSRINGELSAKRKKAAHSGMLDFRRTIRKGLESGGSLYRLAYKRSHAKRRRLVLLLDVSGSMIQFSEFALRFIRELDQISDASSVYLFSEEIVKADPFSLQNLDLFRGYVQRSGLYGRGTDLGKALRKLCSEKPPVLNHATTLLILSDAKTIDQNRAVRSLLDAKRMAGQLLFLNPIPENKWKYLNSSQTFASVCTMLSCATLHDLASACRRLTVV